MFFCIEIDPGCAGIASLKWLHNGHDGVSNHQLRDCLLNIKALRRWPLCGEFTGYRLPHKGPVTRKMFPFDDVIMIKWNDQFYATECGRDQHRSVSWTQWRLKSFTTQLFVPPNVQAVSTKTSKLHITVLLWRKPPVPNGYLLQRASFVDSCVSLLWRHHGSWHHCGARKVENTVICL